MSLRGAAKLMFASADELFVFANPYHVPSRLMEVAYLAFGLSMTACVLCAPFMVRWTIANFAVMAMGTCAAGLGFLWAKERRTHRRQRARVVANLRQGVKS